MEPCKVCVEKSDQIREILRPFQLEHVEPVGGVRILGKSLAEARAQVAALRNVCAEAYQLAGAIGAPVAVLDNLSDASQGQALRHETFLPVLPEDCAVVAALTAERDAAKAELVAAKQATERLTLKATRDLPMSLNLVRLYSDEVWRLVGSGLMNSRSKLADITLDARGFLADLSERPLAARAPEGTEGKDKDGEA